MSMKISLLVFQMLSLGRDTLCGLVEVSCNTGGWLYAKCREERLQCDESSSKIQARALLEKDMSMGVQRGIIVT